MWNITNNGDVTTELYVMEKVSDAYSGTKSLHFYSTNKVDFTAEQVVTGLAAGIYNFSVAVQGGDAGDASEQEIVVYAIADGKTYETTTRVTAWREFTFPKIEGITTSDGTITVGIRVKLKTGAWGTFDDFLLAPVEE